MALICTTQIKSHRFELGKLFAQDSIFATNDAL